MPRREYTSAGQDDAVSTEGLTFTIDGTEFTCHGRISAFDLSEFAGPAADAGEDILDPGVMRILSDLMRAVLGDETYRALRRHTRAHRTPDEVIQQILMDLTEDAVSRPSPGPSQSPAGPAAPVPASSAVVSRSPAGRPATRDHLPPRQRRARQPKVPDRAKVVTALASDGGDLRFADAAPRKPRAAVPAGPPMIRRISASGETTFEPIPETGTG